METVADNVIVVPNIEPRLKHPTIFARFDELEGGETLFIHNDHDPKPVYYQLLGERGDIFTWEYLEQGPVWWKIKITKRKPGEGSETLGELATKDLRKAQVFKKYGLDFCCGGKKTVKEACLEKGIDVTIVEQELQQSDKMQATFHALPYNDWGIDFLADYVVNTHHAYVRKNLPEIRKYAHKVKEVHGQSHPELHKVYELVEAIHTELTEHMHKEETIVFPYIKQIVQAKNNGTPLPKESFGSVNNPIKEMITEHEEVGNNLAEIHAITKDYTLPNDACASYGLLYRMLAEFEEDIHLHIHLENNIMFPKAIDMENSIA